MQPSPKPRPFWQALRHQRDLFWQASSWLPHGFIREQHRLSLGSYGRPRMTEELKELGLDVGHRRVGRLMRQNSIAVVRTRKHKVTTDSNHKFNIAPNLMNRDFYAGRPNHKWFLGDCRQSPVS